MVNAKRFYASCVDEWAIEEKGLGDLMSSINKNFGGWPILNEGPYRRNRQQFLDYMIALRRFDSAQLFEVAVSYNPKNPKRFLLRVNQPMWFFNRVYLFDDKVMLAYRNYMHSVIQYMSSDTRNLTDEIDRIFELERKFSMMQVDADQSRNLTYQNMTIKQLEKLIPDVDFIFLFLIKRIEKIIKKKISLSSLNGENSSRACLAR